MDMDRLNKIVTISEVVIPSASRIEELRSFKAVGVPAGDLSDRLDKILSEYG